MFHRLQGWWKGWRERRAFEAQVAATRHAVMIMAGQMVSENNIPSLQTVSRETPKVNRTGKCLCCTVDLRKRRTGRYPLYCTSCRGERSRQQNREAAARYRAKKARAA